MTIERLLPYRLLVAAVAAVTLLGCQPSEPDSDAGAGAGSAARGDAASAAKDAAEGPTSDAAAELVAEAERRLAELSEHASRAQWVYANFITGDTQKLASRAAKEYTDTSVRLAKEAARFRDLELDGEIARKLDILKRNLTLPAPGEPDKSQELAELATELPGAYGKGKYCPEDGECLSLTEMEKIMATSREAERLLELWRGWRQVSPPMRDKYTRLVELANQGARELGYADVGTLWRSKYDMPAAAFSKRLEGLWREVRPLYEALHCHVRAKLSETYSEDTVAPGEPIPAHLLGNMWAQQWGNIYPLMEPESADPGYDLTERLKAADYTPQEMVETGERFFSSLGFAPLPETFWERSLFTKPQDRDVVCHASAWDIDNENDVRIKMCIDITAEHFQTIHHELGHNYYQRAYADQPFLFKGSANDGFHEAVGDTVALSTTPKYLKEIGLIEEVPDAASDIGLLLRQALDKVAFLPFGLLVDQWRWQVFSGEIAPDAYNASWWRMRERYQGIAPPVARDEQDFDPGAKYHIPANVPYTRYFLAHILQFQFHRALCRAAGEEGPLHRCSIYDSAAAGEKLRDMLAMGRSQPWPVALERLTGQREMDAGALREYFQPLERWLEEQNADRQCGW